VNETWVTIQPGSNSNPTDLYLVVTYRDWLYARHNGTKLTKGDGYATYEESLAEAHRRNGE